ncbi:hypothetical protein HanPSC8_Chr06g0250111 [Helianthus annuus]|nr:hypothetical protein HanPSC8_Chr06g0250111 [Helianthus annuus]
MAAAVGDVEWRWQVVDGTSRWVVAVTDGMGFMGGGGGGGGEGCGVAGGCVGCDQTAPTTKTIMASPTPSRLLMSVSTFLFSVALHSFVALSYM